MRIVKRMNKYYYNPDRTWKNVWKVLRTQRSNPLVLTCKACSDGVSPRGKYYHSIIVSLSFSLGFLLPFLLQIIVFPEGWSKTTKALLSILALMISCLPLASIPVLLSFHIPKWWAPAEVSQSDYFNTNQGTVL